MLADSHCFSEWKNERWWLNEATAGAAAHVANCLPAQYSERVSWIDPGARRHCRSTPKHNILMRSYYKEICCWRVVEFNQSLEINNGAVRLKCSNSTTSTSFQSRIPWIQEGLKEDVDNSMPYIFVFCCRVYTCCFCGLMVGYGYDAKPKHRKYMQQKEKVCNRATMQMPKLTTTNSLNQAKVHQARGELHPRPQSCGTSLSNFLEIGDEIWIIFWKLEKRPVLILCLIKKNPFDQNLCQNCRRAKIFM